MLPYPHRLRLPDLRQLTEQVRLAVATGKLGAGGPLPSVRALAEELAINTNTVARAYAELARDGLIEARPGRGVFVTRKRRVFTREEGWRGLEPLLESLIGGAMAMDFSPEELQEAFEKKLRKWTQPKGGDPN